VREAQGQVGYMNNGWTKSTNTNPSSRLANTLAPHSPPPKKKKTDTRIIQVMIITIQMPSKYINHTPST
jgi:hypothetical protein